MNVNAPEAEARRFFGKYRGRVTKNVDPLGLGRIRAIVPDVTGDDETGWALPCFPFTTGENAAGFLAVASVGTFVWIEFEQGDPDYPIWSGCWFAGTVEGLLAGGVSNVTIGTPQGHTVVLDDTPGEGKIALTAGPAAAGGIVLQTATGQRLTLNADGIELASAAATIRISESGEITLTAGAASIALGPVAVSINNGALEVL